MLDKLLISIFASIATVQTLYFLAAYFRTYALNMDEDVISSDALSINLAACVIAGSFAVKYFLNRRLRLH